MKLYLVVPEAIQQLQNLPSFREHSVNDVKNTRKKLVFGEKSNRSIVFGICIDV